MSRRTKIFLTVILALILVLALILLILEQQSPQTPSTGTNTGSSSSVSRPPPLPGIPTPTNIEPPPSGPIEQNPATIAADFTERYGSYSNEGNYQNLRDLYSQMTTNMQARTETFITSNPLPAGDYFGVTTRAVRTDVVSKTDTEAVISVGTQRQESTSANPSSRIYYQTAELVLVKSGLKWLVDSFEWQ